MEGLDELIIVPKMPRLVAGVCRFDRTQASLGIFRGSYTCVEFEMMQLP